MNWLIIVLSIINISVWVINFLLEIAFYKKKMRALQDLEESDIEFESYKFLDDNIEVTKKSHKAYAVEIAPAYDYFLYQKCPYFDEFASYERCKIWNCPAHCKESDLKCKGLLLRYKDDFAIELTNEEYKKRRLEREKNEDT